MSEFGDFEDLALLMFGMIYFLNDDLQAEQHPRRREGSGLKPGGARTKCYPQTSETVDMDIRREHPLRKGQM